MLITLTAALAMSAVGVAPTAYHVKFVLYGDDRDGHEMHRQLVGMMTKEHPDFVINTGDLVKKGNDPELWKIFDDITGDLRKSVDYYPARGNHDIGDPDFQTRFKAPIKSGNHLYYSFDRANCHFIGLAVDEHTDYGPDSEQFKWLIGDLEANKGKAAHTFVFFHVPPYSIGRHGSDLAVRAALCPTFEKYGVQSVLNGHDHIYYRTLRNGITYVVSGGGGAPLYDVDPSKGALPADKYEKVNHYVVFEVDGDKVHGKAIRSDGTVIEEFDVPSR